MTSGVDVTPDGSPVAIYLALPAEPHFTPVVDDLPAGATVLDLGCGVGRLANVLATRGHSVTGVDESEAMLRHVAPAVTTVQARIEHLRLEKRFDAVVLASHFVNAADSEMRRAVLGTAATHVAPAGRIYIEHYALGRGLTEGEGQVGPVHVTLQVLERDGTRIRARIGYRLDDERWTQEFTAELLDEPALDAELERVGLRRTGRLSESWLVASPDT